MTNASLSFGRMISPCRRRRLPRRRLPWFVRRPGCGRDQDDRSGVASRNRCHSPPSQSHAAEACRNTPASVNVTVSMGPPPGRRSDPQCNRRECLWSDLSAVGLGGIAAAGTGGVSRYGRHPPERPTGTGSTDGGDRQANAALYHIALTRLRCDRPTNRRLHRPPHRPRQNPPRGPPLRQALHRPRDLQPHATARTSRWRPRPAHPSSLDRHRGVRPPRTGRPARAGLGMSPRRSKAPWTNTIGSPGPSSTTCRSVSNYTPSPASGQTMRAPTRIEVNRQRQVCRYGVTPVLRPFTVGLSLDPRATTGR